MKLNKLKKKRKKGSKETIVYHIFQRSDRITFPEIPHKFLFEKDIRGLSAFSFYRKRNSSAKMQRNMLCTVFAKEKKK